MIPLMKTCRMGISAWLASFLLGVTGAAEEEPRLNQIQVIGSHNSYHLAPPAEVMELIQRIRPDAAAWNYTHPPLRTQLGDMRLRQFELDVFADPEGGLFANPLALGLARMGGVEVPDFDPYGHLQEPGFKVLHVQDVDFWSNTPTLAAALAEMLDWSRENPNHTPIAVLIECKDTAHPPLPTTPIPFTRERLMELEREILEVIPLKRILRPDDVRRGEATLPTALVKHGWPTLSETRGKFLFLLDNTDAIRNRYLEGNPALEGRLMFASAPGTDHPAAAWFKRNNARAQAAEIENLVRQGFMVRTRSDHTQPDPEMRDIAFASGAHWVSTDHFAETVPAESRVVFPCGNMVRANPITAGNLKPAEESSP